MRRALNSPMRPALACGFVIAMMSGASAQVPVTDAARLPVNLEIKANTQNSAEAKKPVVTTTNGTVCNLKRSGGGNQATTNKDAALPVPSPTSDFAALATPALSGVGGTVPAMTSGLGDTAKNVAKNISGASQGVAANVAPLNGVSQAAGTDDRYQDSWDRNQTARLQNAQLMNQAIGVNSSAVQLLNAKLQEQIFRDSAAAQIVQFDAGSANPFSRQGDPGHISAVPVTPAHP